MYAELAATLPLVIGIVAILGLTAWEFHLERRAPELRTAWPLPAQPTRIGPYLLEELLGEGGNACVYRVTDLKGQPYALKLMKEPTRDRKQRHRLYHEMQIGRDLRHSNLVRIHGLGQHRGHAFFLMDYVDGEPLSTRLKKPVSRWDARAVALQISRALVYAHRRGVAHLDLKPSNVVLRRDGRALVLDFGIAQTDGLRGEEVSQAAGSPSYMSPDQLSGKAGPGSDVYSLGVMLYQMVRGRLPFEGDRLEVLTAHLKQEPPPLDEGWLGRLAMRMLEKDPQRRPAMEEVVRALEEETVEHLADCKPAAPHL